MPYRGLCRLGAPMAAVLLPVEHTIQCPHQLRLEGSPCHSTAHCFRRSARMWWPHALLCAASLGCKLPVRVLAGRNAGQGPDITRPPASAWHAGISRAPHGSQWQQWPHHHPWTVQPGCCCQHCLPTLCIMRKTNRPSRTTGCKAAGLALLAAPDWTIHGHVTGPLSQPHILAAADQTGQLPSSTRSL